MKRYTCDSCGGSYNNVTECQGYLFCTLCQFDWQNSLRRAMTHTYIFWGFMWFAGIVIVAASCFCFYLWRTMPS